MNNKFELNSTVTQRHSMRITWTDIALLLDASLGRPIR
jgi:hypothetical protein